MIVLGGKIMSLELNVNLIVETLSYSKGSQSLWKVPVAETRLKFYVQAQTNSCSLLQNSLDEKDLLNTGSHDTKQKCNDYCFT